MEKAIDLATAVYRITEMFPSGERFNLVSQMQRAATSIPSNISEGCGRNTSAGFKQFLSIATGSSYELETQIILSSKLGYLSETESEELLQMTTEVQKMLYRLNSSLEAKS